MARTYRSQQLNVLATAEQRLTGAFAKIASNISGLLMRAAGPDGTVPLLASYRIRADAGRLITAFFLRVVGGELKAFTETPDGRAIPQSEYASILAGQIDQAQRIAVEQHRSVMRWYLRNAPGIRDALAKAERLPRTNPHRVAEIGGGTGYKWFYDPYHLFVDADGYTLSERIWRTNIVTRRKLDLFLDYGIRNHRGALEMAGELEQFLIPGRRLITTNKPYGTTASFDAMRLARTEITAAAGRAGLNAARHNPFVSGVRWNLSPSHPCCDECDTNAEHGLYTLDDVPRYPAHPHCLCYLSWAFVSNPAEVITALRDELTRPAAARDVLGVVGPLSPLFLDWLNGRREVEIENVEVLDGLETA